MKNEIRMFFGFEIIPERANRIRKTASNAVEIINSNGFVFKKPEIKTSMSGKAAVRRKIRNMYLRFCALLYLFFSALRTGDFFRFAIYPVNWCSVPKGHTQPQKNLPRRIVDTIVTRHHIRPEYIEWVARRIPSPARGSSSIIQFTGQPRSCHHLVPEAVTAQNQIVMTKKKAWLIRLAVVIFMSGIHRVL